MALSRKTGFFLILLLILGSFLAGYIPGFLKEQDLNRRLNTAQNRMEVLALQNELGMILIEVERNNFGNARTRATRFFNDVRQASISAGGGSEGQLLKNVLERRDEIVSDLTALRTETAAKLREIYAELYQAAALR